MTDQLHLSRCVELAAAPDVRVTGPVAPYDEEIRLLHQRAVRR